MRSTKLGFPVIQSRLNLFPPVVQPRLNFTAVTWELQRRLNLFECTNGVETMVESLVFANRSNPYHSTQNPGVQTGGAAGGADGERWA